MGTAILVLQGFIAIAVAALLVLVRQSGPAFLKEKGKNLATKQDIGGITREMERVRLAFAEHQARSSRIFEKQLEAIGGIYERLQDASEHIMHMVHPVQFGGLDEEKQRRTRAGESFNDLAGFYWKHRLYIPEELCTETEALLAEMKGAVNGYLAAQDADRSRADLDRWDQAYKKMRDDVPMLRDVPRRVSVSFSRPPRLNKALY